MGKVDVIVIGGGPAGMICAGRIAENSDLSVVLLEKNRQCGKKLLITGKGRCNVTNNCDVQTLLKNTVSNSRFLYSAFSGFDSSCTMSFFESLGVPLKTERGNRVFPVSDRSSDILNALYRYIEENRVRIIYGKAESVIKDLNDDIFRVAVTDGPELKSSAVVLCTGGSSYPKTGSTGDGYRFARDLGHRITELRPSIVPICLRECDICRDMMGLSLKNTGLKVIRDGKTVYEDFGEMVFTDYGVSGPMVLSASAYVAPGDILSLDLKPALDEETLDRRIVSDFSKYINKDFNNALGDLLPRKMIPVIVGLSGIVPELKVNSVTRQQRQNLVGLLKHLDFSVEGLRPLDEAIITCGGVDTKEIYPKTMESRITENLYFAGEIIDVDAYTGGFNLQIAFSTGVAAATAVINKLQGYMN